MPCGSGRPVSLTVRIVSSDTTYFIDNPGDEAMGSTWSCLDITPLGRQEERDDTCAGYPQTPPYLLWRRHDEYPATGA
jgi:predicted dithiol-disulfide oxidoreductase (DUF899 family)